MTESEGELEYIRRKTIDFLHILRERTTSIDTLDEEFQENLAELTPDAIEDYETVSLFRVMYNKVNIILEMLHSSENNNVYEQMVQKLEAEVRNHIRIEQQLKLHIETVQEKSEEFEKKYHESQKTMEEMRLDNKTLIKAIKKKDDETSLLRVDLNDKSNTIKRLEDRLSTLQHQIDNGKRRDTEDSDLYQQFKQHVKTSLRPNSFDKRTSPKRKAANAAIFNASFDRSRDHHGMKAVRMEFSASRTPDLLTTNGGEAIPQEVAAVRRVAPVSSAGEEVARRKTPKKHTKTDIYRKYDPYSQSRDQSSGSTGGSSHNKRNHNLSHSITNSISLGTYTNSMHVHSTTDKSVNGGGGDKREEVRHQSVSMRDRVSRNVHPRSKSIQRRRPDTSDRPSAGGNKEKRVLKEDFKAQSAKLHSLRSNSVDSLKGGHSGGSEKKTVKDVLNQTHGAIGTGTSYRRSKKNSINAGRPNSTLRNLGV